MTERAPSGLLRATAAAALAPVLWGTTYWTTSELLPPDRPMSSALVRALPAGLLLLLLSHELPRRQDWGRLLVLSALNIGGFFALLFYAAYTLPAAAAATLTSLSPVFALLFAATWLSTRPRAIQLAAAAVCVGGVWAVVGGELVLDAAGTSAAVGAALCTAAGVVLTRRWSLPMTTVALTGWQLLLGGLLMVPLVMASGEDPDPLDSRAILGNAHLGLLGTAVAYLLWMRGISMLPVGAVSALACLSPVTAAAIDWLALGRHLTVQQLVGGALVIVGVATSQVAARPAPAASPRPHAPPAQTSPHAAHRRPHASGDLPKQRPAASAGNAPAPRSAHT